MAILDFPNSPAPGDIFGQWQWDGDKWAIAQVGAAAGDITSIIAGLGLTGGGTQGDITLSLTSPVVATNGGTGLAAYAQGDLLYASAANTLAKLVKEPLTPRYLSNGGASNAPIWAQISLANGVSGLLPVSSGGTAASSASAALTNLGGLAIAGGTMLGTLTLAGAPSGGLQAATKAYVDAAPNQLITFAGDVSGSGSATLSATVIQIQGRPVSATAPTSNQVLQWSGTAWTPSPPGGGGTVTSIAAGLGITVSPSPITSTGSVALSVPVLLTSGGTGAITGNAALDNLTATAGTTSGGLVRSSGGVWAINPAAGNGTITGVTAGTGLNGGGTTGSVTLNLTVPVAPTSGGTGLAAYAQGDLLYASAANTLAALAKQALAPRYLANTGVSNAPAWVQIDLAGAGLSNTLPILAGGTNATTAAVALANLGGLATAGGIMTGPLTLAGAPGSGLEAATKTYVDARPNQAITFSGDISGSGNSTIAVTVVQLQGKPVSATAPTSNQVLQWSGSAWVPSPPGGGGTITSIAAGTGISVSPSPITSTGSIALTIPVAITSGGTGAITAGAALANLGGISGNQNITLSGDASGSGATAIAVTLATVNATVGTFQGITVNSKGLVTAAAAQGYLTGNQAITLSGDVSGSGATAITATLATVNANLGTFQGITVNAKGLVTAAVNQAYAPLASPTFTGIPAAPTAVAGTSTTQLATTAFVAAAVTAGSTGGTVTSVAAGTGLTASPSPIVGAGTLSLTIPVAITSGGTGAITAGAALTSLGAYAATNPSGYQTAAQVTTALTPYAPLASPTFTGTPTLPTGTIGVTQTVATNNTSLATTAFVKAQAYLTANQAITLTGDITGSGATSIAATLATVNSNVGTFQGITVNAKGLVTAAANQSYLTANQAITLTGDVTGSGTTSIAATTVQLQGRPVASTLPTSNQVLAWSGTTWAPATPSGGASITISDTAPGSPTAGSLWWSSVEGNLLIYYNDGNTSQWVVANSGATGATGQGVPIGGTAAQALTKINATDFNTQWTGPYILAAGDTMTGMLVVNRNTGALPAPPANTSLQVGAANGVTATALVDAFAGSSYLILRAAGGTAIAPTTLVGAGVGIGSLSFQGNYGGGAANYAYGAQIYAITSETWSGTARGSYLIFDTITSGTITGGTKVIIGNGMIVGGIAGNDPGLGSIYGTGLLSLNQNANAPQATATGRVPIMRLTGANGIPTNICFDTWSQFGGQISFRQSRGTLAVPSPTLANDVLSSLEWFGRGTTGYGGAGNPTASIGAIAGQNFSDTVMGTSLVFSTASNGGTVSLNRFAIGALGGIMIYTSGGGLPTGGDTGAGTLNVASSIQFNGLQSHAGVGGAFQANLYNIQWAAGAILWIDNVSQGAIQVVASDERLKSDIKPAGIDALAALNGIDVVEYNMPIGLGRGPLHYSTGFLAQQLAEVIPEAVTLPDDPADMLGVQLLPIVSHLIRAVQQLSARIETLEGS